MSPDIANAAYKAADESCKSSFDNACLVAVRATFETSHVSNISYTQSFPAM
jgi:hypothetical protein